MNKISNLIVFENENLVIINKPAGITSIKAAGSLSMHEMINEYFNRNLFIVHRLDKDASGLLIFAKDSVTHKNLNYQFENNLVSKNYFALVHGNLNEQMVVINSPIKEFGSGRMGIHQNGKEAKTRFELISSSEDFTLGNVSILFGRRHQIRVHLYSIGHPIVGDMLYGNRKEQINYPRLMLQAYKLEFNLFDSKKLVVEIPIDSSIENFLRIKQNK